MHYYSRIEGAEAALVLLAYFVLPSNAFTTAFRVASCRHNRICCPLFGDGNPPPFANYYKNPVAPTPPTPPTPLFTTTQAPAPATTELSPLPQQTTLLSPPYSTEPDPGASINSMIIMADIQTFQRSDLIRLIQSKIPDLTHRPHLSNNDVQGYDAPGSSNIAWLADVQIPNVLSSLTVFHGPLTDVPHIVDRVLMVNNADRQWMQWTVDVRPRAYGAYETMDIATGTYPGPETLGRKAFEYSGARTTFFTKFGAVTQQWRDSVASQFEGAVPVPVLDDSTRSSTNPNDVAAILTTGPLALNLQIPFTAMNGQTLIRMRRELAQTWLRWSTEEQQHGHRPGAPINAQYVYDSKYRQNAFLALRGVYAKVFPPDQALALAIAESGPLDEAYVGGGS